MTTAELNDIETEDGASVAWADSADAAAKAQQVGDAAAIAGAIVASDNADIQLTTARDDAWAAEVAGLAVFLQSQRRIQHRSGDLAAYNAAMNNDNDPNQATFSVALDGTVALAAPALTVKDGATVLVSGSSTVSLPAAITGYPTTATLTIENTGTAELDLDQNSLSLPSGFSVVTPFAATVAADASTSLVIQLDAAAAGSYSGSLSFDSNDTSHSPFTVSMSGMVSDPAPDISVSDLLGGAPIANGGAEDFGESVGYTPVYKLLEIQNTGSGTLSLDPASLVLPAGFSVFQQFAGSVAAGSETFLTLEMTAAAPGDFSGAVSFDYSTAANAPDATFSFTLSAAAPERWLPWNYRDALSSLSPTG